MNTELPQQIARKAWKEITDLADTLEEGIADLNGDSRFDRIILSAIERATADLTQELKLTTTQLATERHEAAHRTGSDREEKQ